MIKFNFLTLTIFLLLQIACSKPAQPQYDLPANAKALLTGDSTKTWKLARRFNNKTRMNMGDCFLLHRDTYKIDKTMHNNSGENKGCGETLEAAWKFARDKKGNYYIRLESSQLPALMNIDQNHKLFKVLLLSEDQMTLQYYHRQFSNKTTTITDIYIPENASVKNREFHW